MREFGGAHERNFRAPLLADVGNDVGSELRQRSDEHHIGVGNQGDQVVVAGSCTTDDEPTRSTENKGWLNGFAYW